MRIWVWLCLCCAPAAAQISLEAAECAAQPQGWQAEAQWQIRLPEAPLTALRSGIALSFEMQVEEAGQWWRRARRLATQVWELDYNHLSQSYHLRQANETPRQFGDVDSALKALGRIEALPLAAPQHPQDLRLRLYLAQAQLPFSLRLNALLSAQWTLDSGWQPCP